MCAGARLSLGPAGADPPPKPGLPSVSGKARETGRRPRAGSPYPCSPGPRSFSFPVRKSSRCIIFSQSMDLWPSVTARSSLGTFSRITPIFLDLRINCKESLMGVGEKEDEDERKYDMCVSLSVIFYLSLRESKPAMVFLKTAGSSPPVSSRGSAFLGGRSSVLHKRASR